MSKFIHVTQDVRGDAIHPGADQETCLESNFIGFTIEKGLGTAAIVGSDPGSGDDKCSTDKNSRHENYPEGAENWRELRKAQAANSLVSYKHLTRAIDETMEKHIHPIY